MSWLAAAALETLLQSIAISRVAADSLTQKVVARRRTAVVGSTKGHSPTPAGTGKMRRFPSFA
jgi:hypothetical protein